MDLPSHSPARRLIQGPGTDEAQWLASSEVRDLPTCALDDWVARYRRIWLIAPHPDDEILGLGGSLARLSALRAELVIVAVTDGEASHPGSRAWTPARLASTRRQESASALGALGIEAEVQRLGLADGCVDGHRAELLRTLVAQIEEQDLILATCSFDGHPDHEACGEVAAVAAELTGATVHEYPVWMWHWATPGAAVLPWSRAQRIPLDAETLTRKADAIRMFTSQIVCDGPRAAILPPHVVARFLRPFEVVFA